MKAMGKKKIILVSLIVLLLSTGAVFATSVNGDYKGFPVVNVTLNGEPVTSTVPATNFYGSTVLPIRAVAESLGTIVNWDAKTSTANLVKIGVNMIICESVQIEDDIYSITNVSTPYFTSGSYTNDFSVFYDSDEIPSGALNGQYSLRTVIYDNAGNVLSTGSESTYNTDEGTGFWGSSDYENVIFPEAGDYSLEFQIKSANGIYQTLGKRTLIVTAE